MGVITCFRLFSITFWTCSAPCDSASAEAWDESWVSGEGARFLVVAFVWREVVGAILGSSNLFLCISRSN